MSHPFLLASVGLLLVVAALVKVHRAATRFVPRNRVRTMRRRLHLRMRASRGTATAAEIVWRMGRFAAFRRSSRLRPSLSASRRLRDPDTHSVRLGRAQRGMSIRASNEEHVLVEGPPRSGKTALLSSMILGHDGPVLTTSTKPDLYSICSSVRAQRGPVELFVPQGVGGLRSTFSWSPTAGCSDPLFAARRAEAFCGAVSVKGTDAADNFWSSQASEFMAAALMAADLVRNGDLRLAHRWLQGNADDAVSVLRAAGAHEQALSLAQMDSAAEKTIATIRLILNKALAFLGVPALAESVTPGGNTLGIPAWLASGGTLFMIATSQQAESPVAGVFAALASEVFYQASMIGQSMAGQRLDPSCRFILDELCTICPVPVAEWLSDAGGKGVCLAIGAHSDDQLTAKFSAADTGAIRACCGVHVYTPGITDPKMLDTVSKICGDFIQRARGSEHVTNHPVFSAAMIRQMPDGFGLVIKGNAAPTVVKLERGWKQRSYRQAARGGQAVAAAEPVSAVLPVAEQLAVEAPAERLDPFARLLDDTAEVQAVAPRGAS
jgi:type IV secretion system protein VirD4